MITFIIAFIQHPLVVVLSIFGIGLAAGLWLDQLLLKRERTVPRPEAGSGELPEQETKELPTASPDFDANALYVVDPVVGTTKLDSEHWFEFGIRAYNATGNAITVVSVEGFVQAAIVVGNSIPKENYFNLPPPSLLRDRTNIQEVPNRSEFVVVLRQPVSPAFYERMKDALENGGMQFFYDDLEVIIASLSDRSLTTNLPFVTGTTLKKPTGLLDLRYEPSNLLGVSSLMSTRRLL